MQNKPLDPPQPDADSKPELIQESIDRSLAQLIHLSTAVNFCQFKALGIHPGQLPVLRMVHFHEGLSLRQLSDLLHIKPPTVTVTVQRLEKSGYLRRERDPQDQRITRVYTTPAEQELFASLTDLIQANHDAATAGFTEEELELFGSFLKRMIQNILVLKQQSGISDEDLCPPSPEDLT